MASILGYADSDDNSEDVEKNEEVTQASKSDAPAFSIVEYHGDDSDEDDNEEHASMSLGRAVINVSPAPTTHTGKAITESTEEAPAATPSFLTDENGNEFSMDVEASPPHIDNVDEGLLPPEPAGEGDPEVRDEVLNWLRKKKEGVDFTERLMTEKDFGNPYILQNVIQHFEIDELQSNFPKENFNPRGYQPSYYLDSLMLEVRRAQQQPAVEAPAAAKPPVPPISIAENKSKWGVAPGGAGSATLPPASAARAAAAAAAAAVTAAAASKQQLGNNR